MGMRYKCGQRITHRFMPRRPAVAVIKDVGRILVSDKRTMSTPCENSGMIEMSDSRIRPTWIVRFRRRSDTGIRQKSRCLHIAKIRE